MTRKTAANVERINVLQEKLGDWKRILLGGHGMGRVLGLFGFKSLKWPREYANTFRYAGLKVTVYTTENKPRGLHRVYFDCPCGKHLTLGRIQQHQMACESLTVHLLEAFKPHDRVLKMINSWDYPWEAREAAAAEVATSLQA